jgi:hypothetical protein
LARRGAATAVGAVEASISADTSYAG